MKKLMLFFAILILTNLNAQEKQNDATWEETVKFIQENIGYLNQSFYSYKLLNVSSEILEINFNNDNLFWTVNVKLNDIKSINMKFGKLYHTINIDALGMVVKVVDGKIPGSNKLRENAWLFFEPSKTLMAKRIVKALKQIAYYNHQRQKESKF